MKHNKISAITNIQFIKNFKISVIFLLGYAAVVAGVTGALTVLDVPLDAVYQVDTFVIASKVFLLLLGAITFYSSFKDYIMQGVTRRDFVIGSLTAIAVLCLFYTLVLTGVYFVTHTMAGDTIDLYNTMLLLAVSLLLFYAYYIIGWFLGMAILKYRLIGRFICFVFAIISVGLMEITTNIGFSHVVGGADIIEPLSIPLVYNLLSTVIISFLVTYYVYSKAKKIYIRV